MGDGYYLFINETPKGPYTLAQVQSMWRSGTLTLNTLYRKEGLSEWLTLASLQSRLGEEIEPPRTHLQDTAASFQVILTFIGANKLRVINELRRIIPSLGLAAAKSMAENPPQTVRDGLTSEQAAEISGRLSAAGARTEISSSNSPLQPRLVASSPRPVSSPILAIGCSSVIAIFLLALYLTKCSTQDQRTMMATLRATPRPVATARPTPKNATDDELRRLSESIAEARQKVDWLLRTSMMSMDIAVSDEYYIRDDAVSVEVSLRLLSADAQKSYIDGSLKRQIYPVLKGVYLDSLHKSGFPHANVYVSADVTK